MLTDGPRLVLTSILQPQRQTWNKTDAMGSREETKRNGIFQYIMELLGQAFPEANFVTGHYSSMNQ